MLASIFMESIFGTIPKKITAPQKNRCLKEAPAARWPHESLAKVWSTLGTAVHSDQIPNVLTGLVALVLHGYEAGGLESLVVASGEGAAPVLLQEVDDVGHLVVAHGLEGEHGLWRLDEEFGEAVAHVALTVVLAQKQ